MGKVSAIGLALAPLLFAGSAHAQIANGSFETGDFTGWTPFGNTTNNGVFCPGAGSNGVANGNCAAFFGPVGTTGGISQSVATSAGQSYNLSFWLISMGPSPNTFEVLFGGNSVFGLANVPSSGQQYNVSVTATSASSLLSFVFRDDPSFLLLDNVSIARATPGVPEPATWAMMLFGFGAMGAALRRRPKASTTVTYA